MSLKVKDTLTELSIYTEYLNNNSDRDLQPTHDPTIFTLIVDKRPYPCGESLLDVFSGQECETGKPVCLLSVLSGKECETGKPVCLLSVLSGKECETGKPICLLSVFSGKECETGKPVCCVLWKGM